MKVKQMTPVVHTDIPTKKILSQKNVFFLIVFLHFHLIDLIRKQTFVGKKFSTVSFTSLNVFLIFHFKHVFRKIGRKVVTEPIFSMDRCFTVQLCLGSPP